MGKLVRKVIKNVMFRQGKGAFFKKKYKRKIAVLETVLAHPRTKISQVPPTPGLAYIFKGRTLL